MAGRDILGGPVVDGVEGTLVPVVVEIAVTGGAVVVVVTIDVAETVVSSLAGVVDGFVVAVDDNVFVVDGGAVAVVVRLVVVEATVVAIGDAVATCIVAGVSFVVVDCAPIVLVVVVGVVVVTAFAAVVAIVVVDVVEAVVVVVVEGDPLSSSSVYTCLVFGSTIFRAILALGLGGVCVVGVVTVMLATIPGPTIGSGCLIPAAGGWPNGALDGIVGGGGTVDACPAATAATEAT